MKNNSRIEVLVLRGTPKERGRVHGESLRPMIFEVLDRWKYQLGQQLRGDPDELVNEFVEGTGFISAVEKWTPHLLEEVEGIADGAGADFNDIFALQLMDEGGWYLQSLEQRAGGRCSSLGCFREGDSPAILAQNLDWSNYIEGLGVLFRIKHPGSKLESLVPTVAGVIGTCGLNNRPIGICTNALWSHLNSSTEGLPVNFIVREVLEKLSLDAAIDFIHEIGHASGENYVMGDAEKVVDFECSPRKVVQHIPYEGSRRVYHTNHPLVNDNLIFPSGRPPRIRLTTDSVT